MASLADVNFALLQRDERRKLEESARIAQQDTQKRSSKMGLGRLLGTIGGTLLGMALAPVTGGASLFVTSGLAGVGSRVGSAVGATSNIRETSVQRQKLYRDTAADLRDEQFQAQKDLDRIANVRALTDAFSVFSLGSTAGGQAVMQGAQAGGLSGAWHGGKEYAKSKLASLTSQKAALPTTPEIAQVEGALPWQNELSGKIAVPKYTGFDPRLTAGQKIAQEGGSKLGTAAMTTMTGPKPLAPIASTAVGINPAQLPIDMLMRNTGISGTGPVQVSDILKRAVGNTTTGHIASGAGRTGAGIWSNPLYNPLTGILGGN